MPRSGIKVRGFRKQSNVKDFVVYAEGSVSSMCLRHNLFVRDIEVGARAVKNSKKEDSKMSTKKNVRVKDVQMEGIERADLEDVVSKKKKKAPVVAISKKKSKTSKTAKAEPKSEKKGKMKTKKANGKKKTVSSAPKKFTPKDNRILGKYRPNATKGKIVQHLLAKKKATEDQLKKLGGKHSVMPLVYSIRRFGKRTKMFDLFPSKKTEGLWLFKMKGAAPKVKMDKKAA